MSPLAFGVVFLVAGLVVVIALYRLNRNSSSGGTSDPGAGGVVASDSDAGESHHASADGAETSDSDGGNSGSGDSGGDSGGGD